MPILEGIITKVIAEIVKQSAKKGWKTLSRQDRVLEVLRKVGLKPGSPEPNFQSVYAHTLVEYGIDKPKPILDLFRHEDIKTAFQKSFDRNDFSILRNEAAGLIEWNKIGDALRDLGIDPRTEFAGFSLVFNELVNRTRTPVETRQDHKLDKIIKLIEEGDLEKIRSQVMQVHKIYNIYISETSMEEKKEDISDGGILNLALEFLDT